MQAQLLASDVKQQRNASKDADTTKNEFASNHLSPQFADIVSPEHVKSAADSDSENVISSERDTSNAAPPRKSSRNAERSSAQKSEQKLLAKSSNTNTRATKQWKTTTNACWTRF